MPAAPTPGRHFLAWPGHVGIERLARDAPPPVGEWVRTGRPLVVRRRADADPPGACPLALTLPPAARRARFAVSLPAAEIARFSPPPALRELFDDGTLPAPWHPTVTAVLALGRALGAEPRVFGSALWQHLSRLAYLHAGSDLDLLWFRTDLPTRSALDTLLLKLRSLAGTEPRLDGEILLPDGSGVQWRELAEAGPRDEVLLKGASFVRLVPAGDLHAPIAA